MPVRIGQIGVGHVHAPGKTKVIHSTPGLELVGIFEPDPVLRATRANTDVYRDSNWLASADQLLDDPTVLGVVIEMTPFDGLAWAYRALEAGKHVHLDKAPGLDFAKFREASDLARNKCLLFQQGYQLRYNTGVEFLFGALRSGMLGEIQSVRGRKSSPRLIYDSLRVEVGQSPGGMMYYIGCHLLDLVIGLLGRPTEVHSILRRDAPVESPIIDSTVVVLEFPSAIATIETTALEVFPVEKRRLEVYGSEGSVILDPMEPPTVFLGLNRAQGNFKAGWQMVDVGDRPRYVADMAEFAHCIATGEAPRIGYGHDLLTHEILLRSCGVAI